VEEEQEKQLKQRREDIAALKERIRRDEEIQRQASEKGDIRKNTRLNEIKQALLSTSGTAVSKNRKEVDEMEEEMKNIMAA
jgi:hypothetical protein